MKTIYIILVLSSLLSVASADDSKILHTVPDIKQSTDYSCGATSLLGVLAYYGKKATEKELVKETKTDPEVGVGILPLVKAAKKRGLKAVSVEYVEIKQLEDAVMRGQLAIILGQAWRDKQGWFRRSPPWEDEWDSGHYMVVIGFDQDNIIFEDPWIQGVRGFIPKKEFLKRWHCTDDEEVPTQRQAIFFEGVPDVSKPALSLKSIRIN